MNSTPTSPVCPDCGAALPADAPDALCPACLLRQALVSRTLDGDDSPSSLPPPSPEEIAGKFPQFEITECLGRGGMGVVYKARQKSLDRWVAIKILAPERLGEEKFAERFAREAATLAKLTHPNIVTVHDYGETGGLFYIVMEYIDGVNLRDLLRDGKLEPQQALAIVPPICDALQYAHDKGIVHRDIKPENLLLDRDGRIKIADFGIAKLVAAVCDRRTSEDENSQRRSQTAATMMAGTLGYSAPEQANGSVDHRADIYALGVVLYEMLTGERPNKELVAPSKKVQIDVRLDEIVLRALEKTPALRYQTAGDFRTRVETIVSEMGIAATSAATVEVPSNGMMTDGGTGAPPESRFSRTAIVGACWAFMAVLHFAFPTLGYRMKSEFVPIMMNILGLSAPIGTTILGWIAVWQICRSAGRLHGLRLAVFDGLLFPLLLLVVAVAFTLGLLISELEMGSPKTVHIYALALVICAPLCWLIIRRVWRKVNSNKSTVPQQTGSTTKPTRFPRKAMVVAAYLFMALSFAVLFAKWWNEHKREGVWVPARISNTITQQYGEAQVRVVDVSRTGQLVLVSFVCEMFSSDHELMVMYSGPVLSYPDDLVSSTKAKAKDLDCLITSRAKLVGDDIGEVLAGTNVLSDQAMFRVGFVLPDAETAAQVVKEVQEVHLGKPCGLGKDKSVLLLFSLRRDFGKDAAGKPVLEGLDGTLWLRPKSVATSASQPRAQTVFDLKPVIELTIPMNEEGFTDMLDPETGEVIPSLNPDGSRTSRKGLLVHHESQAAKTELVGMNGVMTQESRADQWDEITNLQALETLRKNVMSEGGSVGAVVSGQEPHTFLFKTGNGKIGILQITSFTENPPGVKIRYKLVQNVATKEGASAKPSAFKPIPAEAARLLAELKGLQFPPAFAGKDITSPEVMKEFQAEVAKRTAEVAKRTAAIEQLLSGTAAEPLVKQQKELLRQLAEHSKTNPADANAIHQQLLNQGKQLEAMIEAASQGKPAGNTPGKPGASTSLDPARPLESLAVAATELIAKYFPDENVSLDKDEFSGSHATQEFKIHNQSKTGEATPDATKETGPSFTGFILQISRKDNADISQAAVPQTLREPYWSTFINSGYNPASKRGVWIRYAFGGRVNPEFHKQMLELLSLSAMGSEGFGAGTTLGVFKNTATPAAANSRKEGSRKEASATKDKGVDASLQGPWPYSAAYQGLTPLTEDQAKARAVDLCAKSGMTNNAATAVRPTGDYFQVTVSGNHQGAIQTKTVMIHRFRPKGDSILTPSLPKAEESPAMKAPTNQPETPGSIVPIPRKESPEQASLIQQLREEIARLEANCTPPKGTERAILEARFGAGKPTVDSKVLPAEGIPTDSPYRAYDFCTDGTLFVRYDPNWRVEWATYLNPYSSKGLYVGYTIKPEMELGELEQRRQQMKRIAAEYEKRFPGVSASGKEYPSSASAALTLKNDAIARLAAKLSATTEWENGAYKPIELPESATAEELVGRVFQTSSPIMANFELIEVRKVEIPSGLQKNYLAALCQTGATRKIVLLQFRNGGWWSWLYDADETAKTEPPPPTAAKSPVEQAPNIIRSQAPMHYSLGVMLATKDTKSFPEHPVYAWPWVKSPGAHPFADGMTVADLISKAGGLVNDERVKDIPSVYRPLTVAVMRPSSNDPDPVTFVFQFSLDWSKADGGISSSDFKLQQGDLVVQSMSKVLPGKGGNAGQVEQSAPPVDEPAKAEPPLSKEAQAMFDGLNLKAADSVWQTTIDWIERPETRPPNTKDSGEVTAFLADSKMRLKNLGVSVAWNAMAKRYEVVADTKDDPIGRLTQKLTATHGEWINGLNAPLDLPPTASSDEVLLRIISRSGLGNNVRTLEMRKDCLIQVIDPGGDPFTAALIEVNAGKRIVLFRREGNSWWSRVFELP